MISPSFTEILGSLGTHADIGAHNQTQLQSKQKHFHLGFTSRCTKKLVTKKNLYVAYDDNVKITFVHTFGDNNINYKENAFAASRAAACPHSAVTNVQFFDSSGTGQSSCLRVLVRQKRKMNFSTFVTIL